MGGVDKLDQPIGDRPLLAHTLSAIAASPLVEAIVVVTGAGRRDEIAAAAWLPPSVRAVVAGGESRHGSMRRGFDALEAAVMDPDGSRITLVHDGARPIVSVDLIDRVTVAARRFGAAIPVVPVAETVKRVTDGVIEGTVDRAGMGLAQTPQGVRRSILRQALMSDQGVNGSWTDEAALLEACRIPVHVVPGEDTNIKVTVPADLQRVSDLITGPREGPARRTGIGQDEHGFGPGEPLTLGGIAFAGAPRLHGHSDGDVVLHAIADALLGASGLGDLGRLFPAGPGTPKGVSSRDLLRGVVDQLLAAGWRPVGLDVTIVAARPHLGGRLDEMRDAIAGVVGVQATEVDVKASTGNLYGSSGAGRSISALALATIEARR